MAPRKQEPDVAHNTQEQLDDAEIARRIDEKARVAAEYAQRTGARVAGPVAKPHVKDPAQHAADVEQAEVEAAAIRARLVQLDEEIKAWRKQEAAEKAMADAEAKASRLALGQAQQEAQERLARARAEQNLLELERIADEAAGVPARNAQMAEASGADARERMKAMVAPWLHEVSYTMRRLRELDAQYRRPLETFASLTVSTAPAEFPAAIRNALSAKVYRPSEAVLNELTVALECGRAEPILQGETLETVLQHIAETGIWHGGVAQLRLMSTTAWTRDLWLNYKDRIENITSELTRLYKEGRAAAGTAGEARPDDRIANDKMRLEAKREALTGKLTSGRQTTADLGGPIIPERS